eukprot:m51a1_g12554 hypothetical protein (334) ;mRNA; r:2333-4089
MQPRARGRAVHSSLHEEREEGAGSGARVEAAGTDEAVCRRALDEGIPLSTLGPAMGSSTPGNVAEDTEEIYTLPSGWDLAGTGTVQHLDFSLAERASSAALPSDSDGEGLRPRRQALLTGHRPKKESKPCCPCCKRKAPSAEESKLGQWPASAIVGNDCTSSIFYTSGLCAAAAGKLAPVALLSISVPLYFYRFVYSEVVLALPLNGGVYNVLLNATTKKIAALTSVLIILSYIATAVVSADSAASYLAGIKQDFPLPYYWLASLLLLFFAILSTFGIRDSSSVALSFFLHHMICMLCLAICAIVGLAKHGSGTLKHNWSLPSIHDNYIIDIW